MHYAVFFDPICPVVILAGDELGGLDIDAPRIYATLDEVGASPHGSPFGIARLIAPCSRVVVVATLEESDDNIRRFTRLAEILSLDLGGQTLPGLALDMVITRPEEVGPPFDLEPIPEVYAELRLEQPDAPLASHQLARALFALGQTEKSLRILSDACKREPEEPLNHYHLGYLLFYRLDDAQKAIAPLRRAADLAPDEADPHQTLGIALSATGRYTEARSAFQRAADIAPDSFGAWMNLATACELEGDCKAALGAAKRALALDPESAQAHSRVTRYSRSWLRRLREWLFKNGG